MDFYHSRCLFSAQFNFIVYILASVANIFEWRYSWICTRLTRVRNNETRATETSCLSPLSLSLSFSLTIRAWNNDTTSFLLAICVIFIGFSFSRRSNWGDCDFVEIRIIRLVIIVAICFIVIFITTNHKRILSTIKEEEKNAVKSTAKWIDPSEKKSNSRAMSTFSGHWHCLWNFNQTDLFISGLIRRNKLWKNIFCSFWCSITNRWYTKISLIHRTSIKVCTNLIQMYRKRKIKIENKNRNKKKSHLSMADRFSKWIFDVVRSTVIKVPNGL